MSWAAWVSLTTVRSPAGDVQAASQAHREEATGQDQRMHCPAEGAAAGTSQAYSEYDLRHVEFWPAVEQRVLYCGVALFVCVFVQLSSVEVRVCRLVRGISFVYVLRDFPGIRGPSSIRLQNVLHKKDQHAYRRPSCFRRWVIWRKLWCWSSRSSTSKPWVQSWSSSSRRLSLCRKTCK